MKEKTRLKLFTLFDILAFCTIYFVVCQPVLEIKEAINTQAAFLKYNTRMYFSLIAMGLPIYHLLWSVKIYLPRIYSFRTATRVFYGLLALVLLFAFALTVQTKQQIKKSGYFYCAEASTHMNISHFAVYVLNGAICDRLAKEETDSWPKP